MQDSFFSEAEKLRKSSHYAEALRLYRKELSHCQRNGDARGSLDCLISLGDTYRMVGNFDQTLRMGNLPFRVVGVLATKGQSQFGQDQDDTVMIPYTAAMKKLLSITHVPSASVSATSPAATFEAQGQIERLLRQRHNIRAGDEDDFGDGCVTFNGLGWITVNRIVVGPSHRHGPPGPGIAEMLRALRIGRAVLASEAKVSGPGSTPAERGWNQARDTFLAAGDDDE